MAQSNRSTEKRQSGLSIDEARKLVATHLTDTRMGSIEFRGFDYSRELELGMGIRAIVVSNTRTGGVAAFREDGSLLGTLAGQKVTSIQIFDLDGDGVSELMTEEIKDSGTGVLVKEFVLYHLSGDGVAAVWRMESLEMTAPWSAAAEKIVVSERRSFVRFDAAGFGEGARLTYVTVQPGGKRLAERGFEMKGGRVTELRRR